MALPDHLAQETVAAAAVLSAPPQINDFGVEHSSAVDWGTGDRFSHSEPLLGVRIIHSGWKSLTWSPGLLSADDPEPFDLRS
jgi:hypothetical protein